MLYSIRVVAELKIFRARCASL